MQINHYKIKFKDSFLLNGEVGCFSVISKLNND